MEFLAKNYLTRTDLEKAIRSELGVDIGVNKQGGHTITGSRSELKLLSLSDTTSIYGVGCVINNPQETTVKILDNKLKNSKK